jgi:predicted nucleic acid-binding protein
MSDNVNVFFDSNVLVYVVDDNEPKKQKIAVELITHSIENNNGMISTQSLQEFYNVVTKKMMCTKEKALLYITNFIETFEVKQVDCEIILHGIDLSIKTQFSFWDSLILAAASDSGCLVCYSEDLNNGQVVDGVKILNPFSENTP